jgi:hypothetical protein
LRKLRKALCQQQLQPFPKEEPMEKREAYLKEIWKSTRKDAGKEEERPGSQIKVS